MPDFHLYRKAWRFSGAPHEEHKLTQEECEILLKQGGLLVRNTYDFDCQEETKFWFVIKDRFEGFDELSSRVRNKIRHAQNAFDYHLVDQSLLKEKGYSIMADTFADYAVTDRSMNPTIFNSYLSEHQFDCWGVFDKKSSELIGFSCVRCWTDSCEYDLSGMKSSYKRNGSYPYYGLYHAMNEYYLQEKGFKYVSDGTRSITEHSQIHEFLIQNFNFRKAYCHLVVHYNWWMKIAVKILYPFRGIITIPQVKAILHMESMQR
jgi:hypothetical protein